MRRDSIPVGYFLAFIIQEEIRAIHMLDIYGEA
jgi:hypothetical protein